MNGGSLILDLRVHVIEWICERPGSYPDPFWTRVAISKYARGTSSLERSHVTAEVLQPQAQHGSDTKATEHSRLRPEGWGNRLRCNLASRFNSKAWVLASFDPIILGEGRLTCYRTCIHRLTCSCADQAQKVTWIQSASADTHHRSSPPYTVTFAQGVMGAGTTSAPLGHT